MDEGRAPARRALTVEGSAGEAVRAQAVVAEVDAGAGDLLAFQRGEERTALLHGIGSERCAEHADERRRHEGVEHHGGLHRRALAAAQQVAGPLRRLAAAGLWLQL